MTEGSSALPAETPTGHLEVLDSLRGVAILGVLVTHAAAVTLQTATYSRVLYAAKVGVELFYLVSAFTIFMSVDRRSSEKYPTTNFYLRRFFRIAPLFYISLFLNYVRLRFAFVHGYRPSLAEYGLGFLFLFGFSPILMLTMVVGGWSIAVETTFYAIVPLLRRWIRTAKIAGVVFVACWIPLNVLSAYLTHRYASDLLLVDYFGVSWFAVQLPVFLMGVLIYRWWKRRTPSFEMDRRVAAVIMLVAGVAFVAKHLVENLDFHSSDLPFDTFVAAAFFVAALLHPSRWLANGFTRYLGKLSYSIYLLHFFVMEILPKVAAALLHQTNQFLGLPYGSFRCFVVFLVVAGALAVAVAVISWRWVETPGIRLGRWIIAKRECRGGSAQSPGLLSKADTPDAQF